jgi:hypothetical protein
MNACLHASVCAVCDFLYKEYVSQMQRHISFNSVGSLLKQQSCLPYTSRHMTFLHFPEIIRNSKEPSGVKIIKFKEMQE